MTYRVENPQPKGKGRRPAAPPSSVGHFDQRHPHCPGCDYDLVATVAAKGRVCPECGYEFEVSELWREPRPGDWTIAIGLRRAVISLIVRSLIAIPVWTLGAWAATELALSINRRMLPVITLAVILAFVGILVGVIMSRRLVERAGFVSILLTILTCAFALGAVTAGTFFAHLLEAMTAASRTTTIVFGWLAATIWIIWSTLFDD